MTVRRSTQGLLVAAALSAVLLAGCSSDGSDAATTTTGPAASSTTSAPATTTAGASTTAAPATTAPPTTASTPKACTTGAPEIPAGAVQKPIIDVDGDGKTDIGWIHEAGGTVTVGIETAARGGDTATFDSASPVGRTMLVANADEQGPAEIFLDDGRLVQLDAFVDCQIVPVTNPQGDPYTFGLGFTDVGTGVGCIDTPDGRRLAGLNIDEQGADDRVSWTSTVVDLDGATAKNGASTTGTYQRPADDAQIALLSTVTCGDQTLAQDGIALPQ